MLLPDVLETNFPFSWGKQTSLCDALHLHNRFIFQVLCASHAGYTVSSRWMHFLSCAWFCHHLWYSWCFMRKTAPCLLAPIFLGHFLGHREQSRCGQEDQHRRQEWTRLKTLSLKWHCLRDTQVSLWITDIKTLPCLQEKTFTTKPQSLENVSIKIRIDINAVSL